MFASFVEPTRRFRPCGARRMNATPSHSPLIRWRSSRPDDGHWYDPRSNPLGPRKLSCRASGFSCSGIHFRAVVLRNGKLERGRLAGEGRVVRVHQFDFHLVLAGRESADVDSVVVARICPEPRELVYSDVEMPDAWRYLKSTLPE